ncbi:MAG: cytochrome c oxidase subunit II [Gemmatimonadetes bacterium]|nr:cytochrome c oxidase subunit II [Gemmatimonadota bacterium]MBI3569145.1 cytochrome c oxidase subunit II [Gemmatimonadota bacterium]
MSFFRLRRFAPALIVAAAALTLAACGDQYPNSTFTHFTDNNRIIGALWDRLVFFGTIVFVFVEALLIFTIIKFRKRPGGAPARQIHGNAALEITWTVIPALILVMIAVPTVRAIYKTQAKAPDGSLKVEVIGHQWWWEFRYPELGVVTANELYLPAGRTVNFQLNTRDVLHSFWTPQLGGKRDLITNRTNWLWYTPDSSLAGQVFNGFCVEYCGSSHANMRFRVYTVTADQFASWAKHQAADAAGSPAAAATASVPVAAASVAAKPAAPVVAAANVTAAPAAVEDPGYVFPADKMPAHTVPATPLPSGDRAIAFDESVLAQGSATAGRELITNMANLGKAPCLTCHVVKGEMAMVNNDNARGPNLTHFGSRHTLGGGLFKSDAPTLARWIKNAPHMKPGSIMPTLGAGEFNPVTKQKMASGLDDRQIADIVAYLMSLK